jgi:hypothetical protein
MTLVHPSGRAGVVLEVARGRPADAWRLHMGQREVEPDRNVQSGFGRHQRSGGRLPDRVQLGDIEHPPGAVLKGVDVVSLHKIPFSTPPQGEESNASASGHASDSNMSEPDAVRSPINAANAMACRLLRRRVNGCRDDRQDQTRHGP